MRLFKKIRFLPVILTSLFCGHLARGQADLTFSGGNGIAPMTMTLNQSLTFVITANNANAPYFVFQGVNLGSQSISYGMTGNIMFSINGGTPQSFQFLVLHDAGGVATAQDVTLGTNTVNSVAVGDVVTLSAGTLRTNDPFFAYAAPASGIYGTLITDSVRDTVVGNAVPEPTTEALLLSAMVALIGLHIRRSRATTTF